MEESNQSPGKVSKPNSFTTVTTLSKILALILFVTLPFIGYYLGWSLKNNISSIYSKCVDSAVLTKPISLIENQTANPVYPKDNLSSSPGFVDFSDSKDFKVRVNAYSEENKDVLITLIDISNTKEFKIKDRLTVGGACILINSSDKLYAVFSCGTGTTRSAILISLKTLTQVLPNFSIILNPIFWKDFLIYNYVSDIRNRPWEAGYAMGINVISLSTLGTRTLFEADLLNDYRISKIENDTLHVTRVSVSNENNWMNGKYVENTITYDLSLLKE